MPRSGRVVAFVAAVVVLAGCTGPAANAGSPATPVDTPTAAPSPTVPPPVSVTSGPATVTLQPLDPAAAATVTPVEDGSVRIAVSAGESILTAPSGSTFRALDDGSGVVEDAAGVFVAGISTDAPGIRLVQETPTSVRLTGTTPTGFWFTAVAVQDAVWGQNEGGTSLAVTPSAWARAWSRAAGVGLWSQLVAREPDADTPGMKAQLECHQLGARDKATWNLEPWRPDVSGVDMIAARCNPE